MNLTQERFVELWSRNGGRHADAVYADLARRYGEPGRYYHTLRHVRRCLRYFDLARHAMERRDVVELALWCHDVIYVPGARDNEQRSADWMRRWADDRMVMRERICEAILATRHTRVPVELDSRFACDIDLAALGAPRRRFQEDGMRLRAERADLDDRAYALQESKILRGLLARPRIYLTDYFHSRCEVRARANIAWRLGGQGLE
ncbi:Metal-dependent HD superfamily phosphohydrolase [Paraburkholderia sacchari]|uniref:HD domain-containing protein n=1 Tax=Paraburkholderia sacchari TaxID=159450 RepID=UPI0039A5BE40